MGVVGLRAGTSAVALPAPVGVAMMGYGARAEAAQAILDPLHARALHLSDGAAALLWIQCDLCLIAPCQADEIRRRIARRTGLAPAQILVGCIHTHSGPDTGLLALVTGRTPPPHVRPIEDAIVEAGVRAVASASPARLGVGHGRATIGRNRRLQGGPLDPDVLVLRVDRADGAPLAVLFVHGCHPTALGHDNLAYSADWPGAAAREIQAALPGANPIFSLGAHADVDPRTRGLLDVGVPGQSVGVSCEEMERLGRELGRAVVEVTTALETRADAALGIARTRVAIPIHPGSTQPEEREQALALRRAAALAALGVEDDPDYGIQDLYRLEAERLAGLPREERRARAAQVRRYLRDRTAERIAGGLRPEVEVQVLLVGPARLLALPLEATVDVGRDWKRRVGTPDAAVLSIANGWLRYLPHPINFSEPSAEAAYEVLQSTFVPEAATQLLEAGERLLADLEADAQRRVGSSRGAAA